MSEPTVLKVLACPFCGYDDVELDEIDRECFAVCCPECECIGPVSRLNIEEAIELWNVPAAKLQQLQRHDAIMTEQVLRLEKRIDNGGIQRASPASGEAPLE